MGRARLSAPGQAQTLGDARAAEYMKGKKTLEVNPDHPIIAALQARVGEDAEAAKARPAA